MPIPGQKDSKKKVEVTEGVEVNEGSDKESQIGSISASDTGATCDTQSATNSGTRGASQTGRSTNPGASNTTNSDRTNSGVTSDMNSTPIDNTAGEHSAS